MHLIYREEKVYIFSIYNKISFKYISPEEKSA